MLVNGDLPLDRAQRRQYVDYIKAQNRAHQPGTETASLPHLRRADVPGAGRGDTHLRLYNDESIRRCLTRFSGQSLNILDVGCGRGHYVERFRQLGITGHYIGIDARAHPDWEQYAAVHDGLTATYQTGSIETCALPEGGIDLILSSSALEHIADDGLAARRMFAATRPGGIGLHLVPSLPSYLLYGYHGYRRYDQRGVTALFADAGFEILSIERQGGLVSLIAQTIWTGILELGHTRYILHDMIRKGGPDDALRRALARPWIRGMRKGWLLFPYRYLVYASLWLDQIMPSRKTCGYAVIVRRPALDGPAVPPLCQ